MLLIAPCFFPLVKALGIDQFTSPPSWASTSPWEASPAYASILYLGMRIGKCEFTEILGRQWCS